MLSLKLIAGAVFVFAVACIPATAASSPTQPSSSIPKIEGKYETVTGKGWASGIPKTVLNRLLAERQLASASVRCKPKKRWAKRQFKNPLGMVLWKYLMQVEFCHRNGLITYYHRIRWAEVSSVTPFVEWRPWDFKGHIDGFVTKGRTEREAWTQGHFQVCPVTEIFQPLCNNHQPQLSITVRGDGSWTGWTKP